MTRSYWQNKGARRQRSTGDSIDPNKNWDIIVIGAGITGMGTAHYLRKSGCSRVLVLEKEFAGYGASGRNAGFILSGMAEPYSRLVVGMGHDSAREITRSTLENHELIAAAVDENRIECGYRRSGSYHLAVTEVERRELEESAEMMSVDGFAVEYHDQISTMQGCNGAYYRGGFFNPDDGKIDPFAFVNGLAGDKDLIEGFTVDRIEKGNGGIDILGHGRRIHGEMAVVAVNGYAPLLDSYFEKLVFPVRGQMLATSSVESDILGEPTYYSNFGYDYFRQLESRTLIMGGLRDRFFADEVGYEDRTSPALQVGLEDYIKGNLGQGNFEVENRWGGVMGNTVDGLPLVGALPHNSSLLAAVGFNGHGFGLGMVVARDIARAIMHGESSDLLRRFSVKRFAG